MIGRPGAAELSTSSGWTMSDTGATIERSRGVTAPTTPAGGPGAVSSPPIRILLVDSLPPPIALPTNLPIIVTIDGPAGTGKSSVARALAKRLGLDFLDTGAMYRAAAAIALDAGLWAGGIERLDVGLFLERVRKADLHFDWRTDPPTPLAFGLPIDARLRDPDVTAIVSPIAGIRLLREHMVAKQRIIGAQHPRLVTEGRDQGSVVFPGALVKFYLDASPQVRASRRARELEAKQGVTFTDEQRQALEREIIERDRSDASRADGPLVRPVDAVVVDTSGLSFDQVVATLEHEVRTRALRVL